MSSRGLAVVAGATALVVLVIGTLFTFARPIEHESTATVVLSPDTDDPDRIGSLLESFQRSGTLGTNVELLASSDTTAKARAAGVSITVRAVPDTRTIQITGVGPEDAVQGAVESVISRAVAKQGSLRDLFRLVVLEDPSPPASSGPSNALLLFATVLFAAFAALASVLLLRRLVGARSGPSREWASQGSRRRQKTTR